MYEPEASRLVRNLAGLGSVDLSLESTWDLDLQPIEIVRAIRVLENWSQATNYIVFAIGTKCDTNEWGDDRWEQWARTIGREYPQLGLLLIGAAVEHERAEHIAQCWLGPTLNMCGELSPRESGAVMRQAKCFVGHDSGPMHLAAAVGIPCVAVFSARNKPGIWFPYGERHQILYHKTDCFGCQLVLCERHQKKCIRSITVAEVVTATNVLLSGAMVKGASGK
jgi:ADP-heptose:LPS heptosyltransferase